MSSQPEMPSWLLAALDQHDAGARELRHTSREGFEAMVRRHAHDEHEVAERMAWFDTQRAHLDAAVNTVLAGPGAVNTAPAAPPRSEPEPPPRYPFTDERDEAAEPELPAPRYQAPQPNFELPDAPDRSTRLVQTPGVYTKGLLIGAALAGGTWFVLTGLLRWWLDTAWWDWWPSLLTVPLAAIVLVVWMTTVHDDVQHWIKKGGPRPLRKRFR